METNENKKEMIEKDKCIRCEKETPYPKNLHIDFRDNYIEGAGQLCQECYNEIYIYKH